MKPEKEEGAFTGSRRKPWTGPRGLEAVLQGWRDNKKLWPDIVLDEVTPARPGAHAPIPEGVAPQVREALRRRGIEQLFSHQAQSFELARSGQNLVIATPTASGKSLCYNLPLLDRFAREPQARALYLFPTKALSRDQEESLRVFMREAGLEHGAITFDGDTPADARRAARERSGVLLTNPDMLHTGILPHHANWARLFSNLRYVVIDELHTYRGVFGSHLANVLRRLQRVAAFHGSSPTFILASATIGNPKAHAERMLGREVALVSESGAPSGERRVMVYNPPVVNAELGIRASYLKSAVRLTADLVRAEVSTLLFGQSRNSVEVMLKYLRDRFIEEKMDPSLIQGYRGGYLPGTRRATEAAMRAGEVRCVVATNALELGIDIGSLDAVVCAGYPGSVAALMQRFGRAGRRGSGSLALLVTSSAPLDQYLAADPRSLTGAPVEHARIDPDNVEILVQHLKCASFELPFEEGDTFGDVPGESVADALGFLAQHQVVHPTPGADGRRMFHWSSDAYPANHVSLRSVGWDNVVIIELGTDRTLAEMDFRSAHTMLHEQAIYQHEAEQYQVERFDYDNHKAYVRKVAPDYFTDAMTYVRVNVIQEDQGAAMGSTLQAGMGEVSVIEKVVGYKKIKFHTHENVGYGEVALPEMQMHTTALWLTVPESVVRAMGAPRPAVIDALRGLTTALRTVACVGLMIDPRDLGKTLGSKDDAEGPPRKDGGVGFDPTMFLYDNIPGGVGLAARLFDQREELLRRARRLVEACVCEEGCPACIGPVAGGMPGSAPVDSHPRKRLALEILSALGVVALQ
ncbi:DEAD/DEAH box helicase [Melittangium boletus]|uniref:DEAD/DEAH box helicase n=1 Tax=Melittangium boletus DSM 14713 TaxID=1294270 RepID=A0A250IIS7_9BACT|nr:DEAD/DEAH box helicase [Melittangium boletus]ATB31655.1 DEAD/DEAH box helicase [Melittangium boletus DSM 14713]